MQKIVYYIGGPGASPLSRLLAALSMGGYAIDFAGSNFETHLQNALDDYRTLSGTYLIPYLVPGDTIISYYELDPVEVPHALGYWWPYLPPY